MTSSTQHNRISRTDRHHDGIPPVQTGPIRVLHIGVHDTVGGVETYVRAYLQHIDRTKVQFDFATVFPVMAFEEEFTTLGAKVFHLPSEKRQPIRYLMGLRGLLRDNCYDIVHVNMLSAANVLPLLAMRIWRVPVIIAHSHNCGTPDGLARKFLHLINRSLATHCATDLLACSRLAGEWLFGVDVVRRRPLRIVPNAIEPNKFRFNPSTRERVRCDLGFDNGLVVGHVGRFAQQKNHRFLIGVFAELLKRRPDAHLLLVGDGELRLAIEEQATRLGVSEHVVFAGARSDVEELYQAMDVFVLPSLFEGLSVVGIEAQASGLPCLFADQLSHESAITANAYFLPLTAGPVSWANKILSLCGGNRSDQTAALQDSGYSIEQAAVALQEWYLEKATFQ